MSDPAHHAHHHASPDSPGPQAGWGRRLLEAKIHLLPVAGLAVLGPVFAATLAYLLIPGPSWWRFYLDSVGTGWMSPVLVLVVVVIAKIHNEIREQRRLRREAAGTTVALGVFATRIRYYADTGAGDPHAAAAIDVAHYLAGRVPRDTARSWEQEATAWYADTPAAQHLPPPPAAKLTTTGRQSS